MPKEMRTALGRVRGHGAGHGGTGMFIGQRISALALLILGPWFVISAALTIKNAGFVPAQDFLSEPVNAVGVILFVVAGIYHMCIGMQEIVEDYIGKPITKALLLAINMLLCISLAAAAIYAVLHVNFSGD
ncbi:MAG: succinate dehydrogenase, hydrophobic membrane anchor protein [Alphaproteobacteria bacterium]